MNDARGEVTVERLPAVASEPTKAPFSKRRLRLTTVDDCATELQRVYREARGGRLALADAAKLCYLLTCLAKMRELGDLERRIERLEDGEKEP